MCYHTLYLHVQCGHSVSSVRPLPSAICPPCPILERRPSLFGTPALTSPINDTTAWSDLSPVPMMSPPTAPIDEREREDTEEQIIRKGKRCGRRLAHPLHTYKIDSLCARCTREKEDRLTRFEMGVTGEGIIREIQQHRAHRGIIIRKLAAVEGQDINSRLVRNNEGQKDQQQLRSESGLIIDGVFSPSTTAGSAGGVWSGLRRIEGWT